MIVKYQLFNDYLAFTIPILVLCGRLDRHGRNMTKRGMTKKGGRGHFRYQKGEDNEVQFNKASARDVKLIALNRGRIHLKFE